jgi:hypothetical protein
VARSRAKYPFRLREIPPSLYCFVPLIKVLLAALRSTLTMLTSQSRLLRIHEAHHKPSAFRMKNSEVQMVRNARRECPCAAGKPNGQEKEK